MRINILHWLNIIQEGRCCPSEEVCPDYTEEICDSYGRTHKNLCLFEVMKCRSLKIDGINLTVARNGSCESQGPNLQTPSTEAGEDGKKSTQAENGDNHFTPEVFFTVVSKVIKIRKQMGLSAGNVCTMEDFCSFTH